MNKHIVECFRGDSSLQTSKNFTSDNECSQLLLSIIFLGTQTLKVGHASYLILPTPMCSPQAHACYLLNTHTQHTHQHHPQHRTHTVRQTQTHRNNQNTNRQTDGWTQTDTTFSDTPTLHRHTTHTSPQHTQYNNTHNTTTRQHDNVLTDKETETETETETDRQTDRPDKIRQTDQTRSDQIRPDQTDRTQPNRKKCVCVGVRVVCAVTCGVMSCDVM